MADVKITALPAAASVLLTDIFPVVVDPGGTPVTEKSTFTVLATLLNASPTFTGQVTAPDGVDTAPGVCFHNSTQGFYWSGSDNAGSGWHSSQNCIGLSLNGTGGGEMFQFINANNTSGIPVLGTPKNSFAIATLRGATNVGAELRLFDRNPGVYQPMIAFIGNVTSYNGNQDWIGVDDYNFISPFNGAYVGTGGMMIGEPGNFSTKTLTAFPPLQLLDIRQKTAATAAYIKVTNETTGHLVTDGLLVGVDAAGVAVIQQQEAANLSLVAGKIVCSDAAEGCAYQFSQPATGATVTIGTGVSVLVVDPAGTIATLTITLPASPVDKQRMRIGSSQIVTTLTVNPAAAETVKNAPGSFTAGGSVEWIYRAANTTWYRIG